MTISEANYSLFNFFLKLLSLPSELLSMRTFTYHSLNLLMLRFMWLPWIPIIWFRWAMLTEQGRFAFPWPSLQFIVVMTLFGVVRHFIAKRGTVKVTVSDGGDPQVYQAKPHLLRLLPQQPILVRNVLDPLLAVTVGLIVWNALATWIGMMIAISGVARLLLGFLSHYGREWQLKEAVRKHKIAQASADFSRNFVLDHSKRQSNEVDNQKHRQGQDARRVRELNQGKIVNASNPNSKRQAAMIETQHPVVRPVQAEPGNVRAADTGTPPQSSFAEEQRRRREAAQAKNSGSDNS